MLFEQRGVGRYVMNPSIEGSFGAMRVEITSISLGGVRIDHEGYLPIGEKDVVTIPSPISDGETFDFTGRVSWNRLLPAEPLEETRYATGIKAIEDHDELARCIDQIALVHVLELDPLSLQRKDREREGGVELPPAGLSRETVLRIREARKDLRGRSREQEEKTPVSLEDEASALREVMEEGISETAIAWVLRHDRKR